MYVDSREPATYKDAATKQGYVEMALDNGDYQSDYVVFERKEIGDLVNSIFARYGAQPRLFEQMDRMFDFCERTGKVPWLIVTGNLERCEQQFKDRKQTLNKMAIYGALASVAVRYAVNIIWSERTFSELLVIMRSISEKVSEGKLQMPMRRQLKSISRSRTVASVANALQISPRLAEQLVFKFHGLYGILEAIKHQPQDILVMDGIGRATFNKMKQLGGVPDE